VTDPAFHSRTAATEADVFAAIYETRVPLRRPGRAALLVVTKIGDQLAGVPAQLNVVPADRDRIPLVGEKPPAISTDTLQSAGGDIAAQLEAGYGDRIQFIHQEVYAGNDPAKGLRAPLRRFGLRSEPWLFVFDRNGRLTARLEGSFGFGAFERALKSAL
jgi:hypothetical protein